MSQDTPETDEGQAPGIFPPHPLAPGVRLMLLGLFGAIMGLIVTTSFPADTNGAFCGVYLALLGGFLIFVGLIVYLVVVGRQAR